MITREHVRHDLMVRHVTVADATPLTPTMVRVGLTGDSLAGFDAAGPADQGIVSAAAEQPGRVAPGATA